MTADHEITNPKQLDTLKWGHLNDYRAFETLPLPFDVLRGFSLLGEDVITRMARLWPASVRFNLQVKNKELTILFFSQLGPVFKQDRYKYPYAKIVVSHHPAVEGWVDVHSIDAMTPINASLERSPARGADQLVPFFIVLCCMQEHLKMRPAKFFDKGETFHLNLIGEVFDAKVQFFKHHHLADMSRFGLTL